MKCIYRFLLASIVFSLPANQASAMRPAPMRSAGTLYLQESGTGAPLGKLSVAPKVMAGHCITMVSPVYPQTTGETPTASTVVVRVVIWKSGQVSPMRVMSGNPSLQVEAMNAVRLWRYKPFIQVGKPVDVTTDVQVGFDPEKPGGIVSHPNQ
jgi:TonB family protein